MLNLDEYKKKEDINNSERDISLISLHSSLPKYVSHHLNFCLDNCTDRDLINFIKWKAEHDIKTFKQWMRIIASTITPQIEQENVIINEWYQHLLNAKNSNDDDSINNDITNSNINNLTSSENKDNENENDSASEEEEHYSISTAELDITPNITLSLTKKNQQQQPIPTQQILSIQPKKQQQQPQKNVKIKVISSSSSTYSSAFGSNKKQSMTLSNLLDLPSSWLLHLFSNYFNFNTLLTKLPRVCHKFRTLCGDPNVWKSIKLPITVIRNIYNTNNNNQNNNNNNNNNHNHIDHINKDKTDNNNDANDKNKKLLSIYDINYCGDNNNTLYFISFLIRSCRLLQTITFEGSIEENDWNAWNHTMKILGNHALRQIKWNNIDKKYKISTIYQYFKYKQDINLNLNNLLNKNKKSHHIIDTLFVRCRHISRRGYCWLQSLTYIPTIEHIHCAALSRSDDVQNMIYNFNHLKTLNVNILGPRHPNRNFHAHHRLALKSISHLIPSSVTEFAIPVSVQEDFVKECFSRMPLLENLDFFRLTTPHQNVDIDSWACCLSSDTIYHLANNCKNLKKCQLFVKCFKPQTPIWDSVKFLLKECKGIHMLTIGMTESETLNDLQKILPPDEQNQHQTVNDNNNNTDDEYDKLSKRYFDQLKKVPFLRKRFRKFKKKTMKFPKFTIMWCLLT